MRRATINKRTAAFFVLAAAGGVGCSDVLGLSGSEDVRVTVDHHAEQDSVTLTIRNESADSIFYWPAGCTGEDVEANVGIMWVGANMVSFREPILCSDFVGGPPVIEASSEYRIGRSGLDEWASGEYRFKLDLRDEDDELLANDARTSNAFRIGQ